jgi:phosphonopyruvate decarboxylase
MDGVAALKVLSRSRRDEIVVLSESTRQDWPPLSTRPELDIAVTGSMSKASSFGLGVALARPDVGVWVLDTDGALLMNLGSLVTIAAAKPVNLLHVVYDNEAYDTTGGQPTPGAGVVDFRAFALDAGYPRAFRFDRIEDFEVGLPEVLRGPGPTLALLKNASRGRRAGSIASRSTYTAFNEIREYLARESTAGRATRN